MGRVPTGCGVRMHRGRVHGRVICIGHAGSGVTNYPCKRISRLPQQSKLMIISEHHWLLMVIGGHCLMLFTNGLHRYFAVAGGRRHRYSVSATDHHGCRTGAMMYCTPETAP